MLTVTDTVSAAKYGIQPASLSRAGDDGADREFIAPTSETLTKGIEGMTAPVDPTVLQSDPTADVPGAYPLPTVTYGMVRPLSLDDAARDDYAAFVEYAAGKGQEPGLEPGMLPAGYSVLPDPLRDQARAAATEIREMQAPAAPEPQPSSGATSSGGSAPSAPPATSSAARRTTPTTAPADAPQEVAVVETVTDKQPEAGPLTPILALARSRFFLVGLAVVAVVSTLGALEVTKRPRRAVPSAPAEPEAST
jgi:hypothetical protein